MSSSNSHMDPLNGGDASCKHIRAVDTCVHAAQFRHIQQSVDDCRLQTLQVGREAAAWTLLRARADAVSSFAVVSLYFLN